MKLNKIGNNQTEITFPNGNQVFFSYNTPVAGFISGKGYLKTDRHYSVTTSKHIKQWLDGITPTIVSQDVINKLSESGESFTGRTVTRYAHKNTTSAAGQPYKYEIPVDDISCATVWTNSYGNPSYVLHMKDGDTYYMVDEYGAMNDIPLSARVVQRKRDLF